LIVDEPEIDRYRAMDSFLSHFDKFFEISPDLLCVAGTDGYFKTVNPAFLQVLEYSYEELLATPFFEFVHPDDLEATRTEVDKLRHGDAILNFLNRYRKKDGQYVTLSWSANMDLQTGIMYAVARDLTAIADDESRLLQIEKALGQKSIIAQTDVDGTIVEVNDKFCEISGYSREELIGQNHRILKSGAHSDAFYKKLWDTISSGKVWSGLFENRKKNGDHYYVHSIITPILDSRDEITNYLSIRFDLTRHINLRQQFKRTLGILNETGAIAKVGGWELDVATGELTWTDETFHILEVEKRADRKPILPEGLDLFTDEHKPLIDTAVHRAMTLGEPYSLELQAKTAKGNVLWVYTNGKANYQDGKIVSLSGTIQDIDEIKKTQEQYEAERWKSIQNAKLASLGELSAGIAHEINNPLSIITGSVELLKKFSDDDELRDSCLIDIERSGQRISRIVKSLRKFSRTDEGRHLDKYVLNDIVNESLVLTEAKARRAGVTINYTQQSKARIYCDEVEIEQVIVNLVNNAIDACEDQEIREISIDLKEQSNWLILRISDTGVGIPEYNVDKLFNPFFTTKDVGKGTGLGLSITRGILEDHGASIELDTRSKQTCFVLRFPEFVGGKDAD